jgi:hypothetical protein
VKGAQRNAVQRLAARPQQGEGGNARALTPPRYGIDALDRGAGVIQRSVGFEIELRDDDWHIRDQDGKSPEKGTPIIHGQDFQLQAEYGTGGSVAIAELVTNYPGLQTRDEFKASLDDMVRLGYELNKVDAQTENKPASDFEGGDPDFVMDKRTAELITGATLQATVGVPLASVAALYKNLEGILPEGQRAEYTEARERGGYVEGFKRSKAFGGLMILLQHYLRQLGSPGADTQLFVKRMIKVMARTDFHSMFALLPPADQDYVRDHMETWVRDVLSGKRGKLKSASRLAADERLVRPTIFDPETKNPGMRITTTRARWLRELRQRDLLTYADRKSETAEVTVFPGRPPDTTQPQTPEEHFGVGEGLGLEKERREAMLEATENLYEGLGKLGGAVDLIQYQGQSATTPAPILEIRKTPAANTVGKWFGAAEQIYNAVDDAIRFPNGHGLTKSAKPYASVMTDPGKEKRRKAEAAKAEVLLRRLKAAEAELDEGALLKLPDE